MFYYSLLSVFHRSNVSCTSAGISVCFGHPFILSAWPIELFCAQLLPLFQLFVTLWTVACQPPLPMEFSRQGYWSGLPFPSPGALPNPGVTPAPPGKPSGSIEPLNAAPVGSDSVRPHRRQPTRLPRPWDSPGKNTGVGCHVLRQLNAWVNVM